MISPNRRKAFKKKEYRDSYVASRVRTSVALQIRALREQRRLSQRDFADRLGKPQSVISRLENTEYGRVSVQTLLDVAAALDIALIVKFCTFPNFLNQMSDITDSALSVDSFSAMTFDGMPPHTPWASSWETASNSLQVAASDALVQQMTRPSQQSPMTALAEVMMPPAAVLYALSPDVRNAA